MRNIHLQKQMTSIIILTHNALEYTVRCVESIKKNTLVPYELIFIDNGSTDGTIEYLHKIPYATIIENGHNRGFAAGCNQGILAAKGEYLVLLNNDTVVTYDWLNRLIWWLKHDPSIGIVGPRSNFVFTHQIIRPVFYTTIDQMHTFAKKWTMQHDRQGFPTDRLSGFCMAFHQNLVKVIGGFDQQFFPGGFEDDDFCIRAAIFGKKLWIANDIFIHHYGNRSFIANQYDLNSIAAKTTQTFFKKWNITGRYYASLIVEREKPFRPDLHWIPLE